jgi:hypothetical protein
VLNPKHDLKVLQKTFNKREPTLEIFQKNKKLPNTSLNLIVFKSTLIKMAYLNNLPTSKLGRKSFAQKNSFINIKHLTCTYT